MSEAKASGAALVQERVNAVHTLAEENFKTILANITDMKKEITELKELLLVITTKLDKQEAQMVKLATSAATKRAAAKKAAVKEPEIINTYATLQSYVDYLVGSDTQTLDTMLGSVLVEKINAYRQTKEHTDLSTATKRNDDLVRYIFKILFAEHPDVKAKVESERLNINKQAEAAKKAKRTPVEDAKDPEVATDME